MRAVAHLSGSKLPSLGGWRALSVPPGRCRARAAADAEHREQVVRVVVGAHRDRRARVAQFGDGRIRTTVAGHPWLVRHDRLRAAEQCDVIHADGAAVRGDDARTEEVVRGEVLDRPHAVWRSAVRCIPSSRGSASSWRRVRSKVGLMSVWILQLAEECQSKVRAALSRWQRAQRFGAVGLHLQREQIIRTSASEVDRGHRLAVFGHRLHEAKSRVDHQRRTDD